MARTRAPVGIHRPPPNCMNFQRLLTIGGIALVALATLLFFSFATTGSVFGLGSGSKGDATNPPPPPGLLRHSVAPVNPSEVTGKGKSKASAAPVTVVGDEGDDDDDGPSKPAAPESTEIPLPFEVIPPTEEVARRAALSVPHGGRLLDLIVSPARAAALVSETATGAVAFSWTLTARQACDIELLLNGGFSPLDGFMSQPTYTSVVRNTRLDTAYGEVLWPMPIPLDVPAAYAASVQKALDGGAAPRIALRDDYHNLIAILNVVDVYRPDKVEEASNVLGTTDVSHPAVAYLMQTAGEFYIGGKLEGIALPKHYDFNSIRLTPKQVRETIVARGWPRTVAFQTRNPMHRAHIELTKLAAVEGHAGVLIHPSVGMTKPGDVEASVRVRCYQAMIASNRYYAPGGVMLSLLPLAMRMAGPKEALWHAIIRKNHGASHFIVGRDHAGCKSAGGKDFYGAYDAQNLVYGHAEELGLTILKFSEVEYVPALDRYLPAGKIPEGADTLSISGTKFRAMMNRGDPIPPWFSDPDVIIILRELMPPLYRRGFAIFFTGLSGGGKTTIAHALIQRLAGLVPTRRITFLDGDVVRTHLSKGLGFSISDRNTNIARIGWVAGEAVGHGGIVLASAIAPFAESRKAFRDNLGGSGGGMFQIYVASSLSVCATRDVKGLYELAANGKTDLTGVSHPYELPDDGTDLVIDTEQISVDSAVTMIVSLLSKAGYINVDTAVPGNVASELGAEEASLITALNDKGAVVPSHISRLVPFFTAGKSDVSASPSGSLGATGHGLCSAEWDRMSLTRDGQTATLYGGLPMKASLAYRAIAAGIPRAPTTGSVLTAPDNVVLGLAHGPLTQLLAYALRQAHYPKATAAATAPVFTLLASRFDTAEQLATVGAANEDTAALLLDSLFANATGTTSGGASTLLTALSTLDVSGAAGQAARWGVDANLASGLPVSSRLSESARLYAAFDLWTHMRWYRQVVHPEAATIAGAPRSLSGFIHPRLITLARNVLRLDPCATIAAAMPAPDDAATIEQLVNSIVTAAAAVAPASEAVKGRSLLQAPPAGAKAAGQPKLGAQAPAPAAPAVHQGELDDAETKLEAQAAADKPELPVTPVALDAVAVAMYIKEYIAAVTALQAAYPTRVKVLTVDAALWKTVVEMGAAAPQPPLTKAPPALQAFITSLAD